MTLHSLANARHTLVHTHFARLLPLFARERAAGRGLVLATLITTAGSTYRKSGAQMLIAANGDYVGLLSGGCLEGDLREHAQDVLRTLTARMVSYDMRTADDALFGLGAGCEGAMHIVLMPVTEHNDWQPVAALATAWQQHRQMPIHLMTQNHPALPMGSVAFGSVVEQPDLTVLTPRGERLQTTVRDGWFTLPSVLPPRLLVCGAGADVQPLSVLAQLLGWKFSVYDHRAGNLDRERFADAEALHHGRPEALSHTVNLSDYDAVLVMSHHLDSDLSYLRQLAQTPVRYVGLLGPAARREKLFRDLGDDIGSLRDRLHAPVGLPIGAATPEAIALAIMAEVHQVLAALT